MSVLMRKALLALSLSFVLAACGDDGITLTVNVATGLVPGPEFKRVLTEIIENRTAFESARTLHRREAIATFGLPYARGYTVGSFGGLEPGEHTVRVTLWRPDGTLLIVKRMRVTLAADYVLTVALTRDCVGVTCPSPAGSPAFSECLAGRCVSPDCNPPEASEACGEVSFCNDATECSETSSCAERNCHLGVCHPASVDDACDDTQWCDPDPGQGCVPFPVIDAGVPSDGGADAGVDASVIECGRTCTPATDPCAGGYWDCTGETPVCARLGQRPTGTLCGDDLACNAAGECVPCRDGESCRIGCRTGQVSCAAGFEQCVLDVPAVYAPSLTECGFGLACVGEDECGTGDLCTSSGECVACRDGDVCNDGCALGTLSCTTGTCTLNGSYLAQGAYCAPGAYCDADHLCSACVENAACIPSLSCWDGEIRGCDGSASCVLTHASAPGTECATGVCSGSGACILGLAAVETAMGGQHNCVRRSDGTAVCFGDNSLGALATGDTMVVADSARVPVDLADIESIASGFNFSCAISAGELWCWGFAWGTVIPGGDIVTTPVHIELPEPVTQMALGYADACVLLASGDVWCSGYYFRGAAGAEDPSEYGFVHMETLHDIVQLSAGYSGACARTSSGEVWCFGYNDSGQAGIAPDMMMPAIVGPVRVPMIDDAIDIAYGDTHACAVRADRSLWCWGGGGEVIHQAMVEMSGVAPHEVTLPFDVVEVSCAYNRSCVLTEERSAWCWGYNYGGMLGVGLMDETVSVPTHLPGLDEVAVLPDLGMGSSACVVQNDYAVCWGLNSYAEVGTNSRVAQPVPVVAQGAGS